MATHIITGLACLVVGGVIGVRIDYLWKLERLAKSYEDMLAAKDRQMEAKDELIAAQERHIEALKVRRALDREAILEPCEN